MRRTRQDTQIKGNSSNIFIRSLYLFSYYFLASQQIKKTSATLLITPTQFDLFEDDTLSTNDVSIHSTRFLG